MPLNANGKVDRAALPEPDAAISGVRSASRGLRTVHEKAMAAMWAELLGISCVGGYDHFFFDLAGNSLLAAQLIDRVNRRFGIKLTMHDLLTTPTVVTLCAKIATRAKATIPAVPYLTVVRSGRGYDPVVCVGFANILPLLQSALPDEVPVWWLKVDGLYAPPFVMRSIAEIAAGFADELSQAGAGRLTLVGHSYCGLIAFELARHLRRSSGDVNVMLLEPSLPEMFAGHGRRTMQDSPMGSEPHAVQRFVAPPISRRSHTLMSGAVRTAAQGVAERATRCFRKWLLRPCLQLSVRLGRELPQQYRVWWYYAPQIVRRIKQFKINRVGGTIWLAGQREYLTVYAPVWQSFVDGKLEQCPLPSAQCHADILQQPSAADWLELVRRWASADADGLHAGRDAA